jgi:hypothetical protein
LLFQMINYSYIPNAIPMEGGMCKWYRYQDLLPWWSKESLVSGDVKRWAAMYR